MLPRRTTAKKDQARRSNPARLGFLLIFSLCIIFFGLEAVEYFFSFRRTPVLIQASVDTPTRTVPEDTEQKTDINRATAAQLQAVPGIGPELAERILTQRAILGGFHFLEEVGDVPGIGEKRLNAIRQFFFCGPPEP